MAWWWWLGSQKMFGTSSRVLCVAGSVVAGTPAHTHTAPTSSQSVVVKRPSLPLPSHAHPNTSLLNLFRKSLLPKEGRLFRPTTNGMAGGGRGGLPGLPRPGSLSLQ